MKKYTYLFALTLLIAAAPAYAQIKTPAPSPGAKFSQDVALLKVEVDYSRPSVKGRKIFGDLVPFGEMWRTGANASTKVTFSENVKVGGVDLPKGTYALYTIPDEKEWTIIFYKNTSFGGVPGKDFNEADVAARFMVAPAKLKEPVETFTIAINDLKNSGADLELTWENTKVSIPFSQETDAKIMADIKTQIEGPSANTYYTAARYYYDEKKDMNQALTWINIALEKGGDKFWILRVKALIQSELGMYKDAIATAERSSELAKADGNLDYQRMNEKSIAEWKNKK